MVKIYAVRDQYTGYGQPFSCQSDAVAMRDFRIAVGNVDNLMHACPKDFDLMRLGEYDPETGIIIPENVPVLVVSGLSVVKEDSNA